MQIRSAGCAAGAGLAQCQPLHCDRAPPQQHARQDSPPLACASPSRHCGRSMSPCPSGRAPPRPQRGPLPCLGDSASDCPSRSASPRPSGKGGGPRWCAYARSGLTDGLLPRQPSVLAADPYECRLREGGTQGWFKGMLRSSHEPRAGARSATPTSRAVSPRSVLTSERLSLAETASSQQRRAASRGSTPRSSLSPSPRRLVRPLSRWDHQPPERPPVFEPPAYEHMSPVASHDTFISSLRSSPLSAPRVAGERPLPAPIPLQPTKPSRASRSASRCSVSRQGPHRPPSTQGHAHSSQVEQQQAAHPVVGLLPSEPESAGPVAARAGGQRMRAGAEDGGQDDPGKPRLRVVVDGIRLEDQAKINFLLSEVNRLQAAVRLTCM